MLGGKLHIMANKNYLSQLSKTIQARNDLKNMYKANQLSDIELYENVSKMQSLKLSVKLHMKTKRN
jgi:hypothetical protein